jgi:3-hydroxyisobutyrate dehydrogenase-like beta-hydroxyacid dehydrogenase
MHTGEMMENELDFSTIGVVSMGDMGHAVARTLREGGHRVLAALDGRSPRTCALAERADVENVGSLNVMVRQSNLILSILPPAAALTFARSVSVEMENLGSAPIFVDCNAVAPATVRDIAGTITRSGGSVIDGSLIGAPPGRRAPTRLYVSGPDADHLTSLARPDMDIRPLGTEIGTASGIKMFYAALTKGTMTLDTLVLLGAQQMGLSDPLIREFSESQPDALGRMQSSVPWLAADAERWVGEMEEIAKTFAGAGLTDQMHLGAADIFRLLAGSALAKETRETADRSRELNEAIAAFAASLSASSRGAAD